MKPAAPEQISDVIRHHLGERPYQLRPVATYTDSIVVEVILRVPIMCHVYLSARYADGG